MCGPSSEVHGPSSRVRRPSLEDRGPSSRVRGPSLEDHGPGSRVCGPRLVDHGPSSRVHGPRPRITASFLIVRLNAFKKRTSHKLQQLIRGPI